MVVAWEVIQDDLFANKVLHVEIHIEDLQHDVLLGCSVEAEEYLTGIGMELGSDIEVCHSGFDFEILSHQVKVVVIKVDHQHFESFLLFELVPFLGIFLP